jgi:hypothetical protein
MLIHIRGPRPSARELLNVVRVSVALPDVVRKINVDAAVKKTGKSGAIAAVCRATDGRFLGASAIVINSTDDPAVLEAMARREALSLAADLNIQKMRIISNCLEVVNTLKGYYFGRLSSVVIETRICRGYNPGYTKVPLSK